MPVNSGGLQMRSNKTFFIVKKKNVDQFILFEKNLTGSYATFNNFKNQ
jgi:hypothetical protein